MYPFLKKLGEDHIEKYYVKPHHFGIFQKAIIRALKVTLKEELTPEII
jgi:hemoglobin-like flavoprotein